MNPEQKAHVLTDNRLSSLEKRISTVYKQAEKGIEKKISEYTAQFERLDAEKKALVKAGKLSDKDYKEWRINKIAMGKTWEAKRENLAKDLVNADKIAAKIINGELPDIYSLNHNYSAYALENGLSINMQYTIYDKATVERLMQEDVNLLPLKTVDGIKSTRWNIQHIQSSVTQGILQGDSMKGIARRLRQVTEMDKNAAIRNARTAVTGAENAGRQDTYARATAMGIRLKKEWLATLDGRTRDSHRQLDGQRADEDKPFKSELGNIMYPGDPNAYPANVYNCRCTMIAAVEDVEEIEKSVGEYQPAMTYNEWAKTKEGIDAQNKKRR